MAQIYVRSSDGSDSDSGATWALAKVTATGAAAIDAAGDSINFASTHAESTAGAVTLAWAGTAAAPVRLLSVSDAAEPPTALAAGASITTTGANAITINGSLYAEGISFTSGGMVTMGGGSASIQRYKSCEFKTTNVGSAGGFSMAMGNVPTSIVWTDCTFYWTNAANKFTVQHAVEIRGGSIKTGSASPTAFLFIGADGRGGTTLVEGFDFSVAGTAMNLVSGASLAAGRVIFRNCKLPASWAGSLLSSGIVGAGLRVELHNSDSTDTNYRLWIEDYSGSIKHETTLVKTGGSSDGAVPFSRKMVSSANTVYPTTPLVSPEMSRWNATVGSAITVTVDILRDSATNLTDADIWLEVQYLGTSGYPLSTIASDVKSGILATAADQDTSSATWTTTGMSNPNKQKLVVASFTPQEAGWMFARVCLAKASTTVYYDAKMQVS